MRIAALLFSGLLILFFTGCTGSNVYYDVPYEFDDPDLMEEVYTEYFEYLNGKTIFLDPGHGGEDRRGRGPHGTTVEADVNLRVALYLRDFLQKAGAIVILSREDDSTVELGYRSELANNSNADIFISIHHNAPGKAGRDRINFTSTYYHATEDDYEYEPGEHDLARFVQRDLAYAMRNSGGLGSFDGTYSDYWIYPGDGFSVLRRTEIPAILIEGGFFTHWMEEERLNIKEFNKIEAWGVFKGLCRYFRAGAPEITAAGEPEQSGVSVKQSFQLKDRHGIDTESITVYVDSVKTDSYYYDPEMKKITVTIEIPKESGSVVRIIAADKLGVYALPFHHKIETAN